MIKEYHRFGDGFFMDKAQDDYNISFYYDQAIEDSQDDKAVAFLLEPKSLIPDAYEYCLEHSDNFKYIFTHDSELLKLPHARYLNWAHVWHTSDVEKTKGISIIASYKDWCPLHKVRIALAKHFEGIDGVDCYGSYRDREQWVDVKDAHERYKFAIVIENDIDDYWYTEKILNCFSNKVIPIYVGAKRIGDIFNSDGIIQVDNWRVIPEIVKTLDIDREYARRKDAIDDNFRRVKPYTVPWTDRFLIDYGWMIREIKDE